MSTKRKSWHGAILYVEDDLEDVSLLRQVLMLEHVSYPLHVAHDGVEAIAYLSRVGKYADRARYPIPALVLLDVKLPKCDGFQVLTWIREDKGLRHLPVIMFSSSDHGSDVSRAYRLGVQAFIVKPYHFEELREIARFLKGLLLHGMLPPTDERDWIALMARDLKQHWPSQHRRAA